MIKRLYSAFREGWINYERSHVVRALLLTLIVLAVIASSASNVSVAAHLTADGAQQTLAPTVVRIEPDDRGRYTTAGRINGVAVGFLVDTESALVRLNAVQAARLGIDFRRTGTRMLVRTASGRAIAYRLRLARVQVGGIRLRGVPALVIDGAEPATVLLGMSFLGRLRLRHEGRLLILAPIR